MKKYTEFINESYALLGVDFENGVETFINNNLAYLFDEGFLVKTQFKADRILLKLCKHNDESFKWKDINTDFIPFIKVFNETYLMRSFIQKERFIINGVPRDGLGARSYSYHIEKILNDEVPDNMDIKSIEFQIYNKY